MKFRILQYTAATMLFLCAADLCAQDNTPLQQMQSGLYAAEALQNQGLIIERQGDAVAAYPLLYDEEGDSRWYFSGTFYEDGRYEADLYALSGGQCLGCPVPMMSPELEIVGNILIVVQDPANLLVSINDGELIEYTALEYGYEKYDVAVGDPMPDLDGDWAVLPIPGTGPANPLQINEPYTFRLRLDSVENPAAFFPAPISNVFYTQTAYLPETGEETEFAVFECGRAPTDRATISGRAYCIINFLGPFITGAPRFNYAEIISADRMIIAEFDEEAPEDNPAPDGEFFAIAIRIQ